MPIIIKETLSIAIVEYVETAPPEDVAAFWLSLM